MLLAARWRERPPVLVVTRRPWAAAGSRRRGAPRRGERRNARAAVADHASAGAARAAAICRTGRAARATAASPQAAREAGFDTIVTAHHQRRPGRDVPAPARARLGRLRACRHARRRSSSTAFVWRGRCSAFRARRWPRSRRRAACRPSPIRATRISASIASACARSCPTLAEHGLTAPRLAETAGAARPRGGGARSLCRRVPARRISAPIAFGVVSGSRRRLAAGFPRRSGCGRWRCIAEGGRRRRLHAAARPRRSALRGDPRGGRPAPASSGRCTASLSRRPRASWQRAANGAATDFAETAVRPAPRCSGTAASASTFPTLRAGLSVGRARPLAAPAHAPRARQPATLRTPAGPLSGRDAHRRARASVRPLDEGEPARHPRAWNVLWANGLAIAAAGPSA